jgi:hypothetical protein
MNSRDTKGEETMPKSAFFLPGIGFLKPHEKRFLERRAEKKAREILAGFKAPEEAQAELEAELLEFRKAQKWAGQND